jgi:hypothetical protein
MKKRKDWIIIDIQTKKALYGASQKALMFSSEEIAKEVAEQLFEKHDRFIVVNVAQDLKLTLFNQNN